MRKWAGFLAFAVVVTACGGGADIEVNDVWGRPSPAAATNGAFYMIIANNTDTVDHLVAASSDACGVTELHQSVMNDGVMGMRPVGAGGIEIPAGGEAVLEVGGLHVMCVDKQVEFEDGVSVALDLEFENGGTVTVDVEIREG